MPVPVICPNCSHQFTSEELIEAPKFTTNDEGNDITLSEISAWFLCAECGKNVWLYYHRPNTEPHMNVDSVVQVSDDEKPYPSRDLIVFGKEVDWTTTSLCAFTGLSVDKLKKLVSLGFADPNETQNDSPTIAEFIEFMVAYPECEAHGYVVSPYRSDCRVSVEGISCPANLVYNKMLYSFVNNFHHADEFNVSAEEGLYCWWD